MICCLTGRLAIKRLSKVSHFQVFEVIEIMSQNEGIMDQLAELLEKNKIYENAMRYCRGMDRKDLSLMKSTFWPEATDNHGFFVGNCHDFCDMAYQGQEASGHSAIHHCSNVLIELAGSKARCESAFIYVWSHAEKSVTKLLGGRYKDVCEKRGDEWKILRRFTIFDWANELAGAQDFQGIFNFPPSALVGDLHPNDPVPEEWLECSVDR